VDEVMALLRSRGYEGWDELEESVGLGMRDHVSSFPYSFLSALRRVYAWSVERTGEALPSIGDDYVSSEDETLIDEVARTMESHLLCHSPTEGVYVPVDIPDPLFDDSRDPVFGDGLVGSSHGLLRELRDVAPLLDIELDADGALPNDEAERLLEEGGDQTEPYLQEKTAFLTLWETGAASVRHETAVWFT
jgi:hypothetical protein